MEGRHDIHRKALLAALHAEGEVVARALDVKRLAMLARFLIEHHALGRILGFRLGHAALGDPRLGRASVFGAGLGLLPQAGLRLNGGARRRPGHEADGGNERERATRHLEHYSPSR